MATSPNQMQEILEGPAAAPPPGIMPNFIDPPNGNNTAFAITSVSLILATIIVAIRAYTKVFRTKRVKIEDAFCLIAFVFYIAHAWSIFALTNRVGFYVNQWNIQVKTMKTWMQTVDLLRTFYFLTICFSKNAILLEWKSIFVPYPTRNTFWWICYGLVVMNSMFYSAVITATHLYCIPKEKSYYPWAEGVCVNRYGADIVAMSFHLFTDLVILVLPQKVIWSLQMRTKRRMGISILFSLGLLTCACAIGRVYGVIQIDYTGDAIYPVNHVILWGVGELTCLLLVFCIPAAAKAFDGGAETLSRFGRSLLSWPFVSKPSKTSLDRDTGPSLQKAASGNSYERMVDGSEVELSRLDHKVGVDRVGKQSRTQHASHDYLGN